MAENLGQVDSRSKKGVLLINLGTPDSPKVKDVKKYLKEFLSDPFVIDIPAFFRFLLVNFIIAPFRSKKSARLYQKIWMENGKSPLLYHSENLAKKLSIKLQESHTVKLSMRYGNPSIISAMKEFKEEGVTEVIAVPLFPQYALATFESASDKFMKDVKKSGYRGQAKIVSPFYDEPSYIEANAEIASQMIEQVKPDHIVMTYHGLPVRHVKKTEILGEDEESKCGVGNCCEKMVSRNASCYRAQCFETSRLIAKKLELSTSDYSVTFQSRFGKDPWIEPFTDVSLEMLKKQGKKNVLVLSPSFISDCLETLEEVAIGLKSEFENEKGRSLNCAPCVNSSDKITKALADKVSRI